MVQELAAAGPLALAAFFLFVALLVALVCILGVVCLRVALRDTSEAARPEIIRALADIIRALGEFLSSLWRRK
ncbi:hypothetical protein ACFVRU_03690 [Streptomyces sp. NPDC057927]